MNTENGFKVLLIALALLLAVLIGTAFGLRDQREWVEYTLYGCRCPVMTLRDGTQLTCPGHLVWPKGTPEWFKAFWLSDWPGHPADEYVPLQYKRQSDASENEQPPAPPER